MGIGKLYFWTTGLLATYFCLGSHYKTFDGSFHRPRNQVKKQKEKAKRAAEAKAEKLASELGIDTSANTDARRQHRRRDDTPAPRRAHTSSKYGRDGSRAPAPYAASRRRRHEHADGASEYSHSVPASRVHSHRASTKHHGRAGDRVKPTPYSDYVPEAAIFSPRPPSPLQPVHSQHGHGFRKPADFAMEDHKQPGTTTRNGSYAPYKHLYGGYDDQNIAPFEGM